MRKKVRLIKWIIFITFILGGCSIEEKINSLLPNKTDFINYLSTEQKNYSTVLDDDLIVYNGEYQEIVINENKPSFDEADLSLNNGSWRTFSDLDRLNRVGVANAVIGVESFPSEAREGLTFKPTGWNQKKSKDGQWLYNRSHLIGFQLTGENNNPKNLMTGTRSLNTPHMLNYENQIKQYIEQSNNYVRYRVTPIFKEDELLARGVQLEAQSIESDNFSFNVYIYNIQEGYELDYSTGKATVSN